MSASRFLLSSTSFIRARKSLFLFFPRNFSPPSPSRPSPLVSTATLLATALHTLNANTAKPLDSASQPHPWPEWVTFIDRLKFEGYLVEPNNAVTFDDVTDYKNMNFVKDACHCFACDCLDLFK